MIRISIPAQPSDIVITSGSVAVGSIEEIESNLYFIMSQAIPRAIIAAVREQIPLIAFREGDLRKAFRKLFSKQIVKIQQNPKVITIAFDFLEFKNLLEYALYHVDRPPYKVKTTAGTFPILSEPFMVKLWEMVAVEMRRAAISWGYEAQLLG